ncbi:hypothetical protein [Mesorhizobium waimense]|uniref:hypothetical protein n=1 Tax=Mesorhizobium waimense TaxID=1300307 RepID=UPI001FDF0699|nr:hypothetical protein [Mesorhizobium waimense]
MRDIGMARQTVALAHELSSQRPDQWSGPPSSCGQSLGGREPPYLEHINNQLMLRVQSFNRRGAWYQNFL